MRIRFFVLFLNQWLTRGSLLKQLSATAVRADVTGIVNESQRFTS